jgi:hypothetical protein
MIIEETNNEFIFFFKNSLQDTFTNFYQQRKASTTVHWSQVKSDQHWT